MLYDYAGREIAGASDAGKGIVGGQRLITWEPGDRYESDASRALSPSKLDSIFSQANTGDPRSQARLAREIEEKDWDTAQALQTRRAAVLGLPVSIGPSKSLEDDSNARKIADEIFQDLDSELLHNALEHLLSGILPGYSGLEIVWGPGGATIEALEPVDDTFFSFTSSKDVLIVSTNHPEGVPLVPNKFVFHRHAARSGDATRGGLIRPLGWMYLFANLGVKDLLRFVEKFGMPFVSARVDDNAWEQDRNKIAYLIRNFGSDGGAVFSKAVEVEFLEGRTDSGELYFRLLEYFGAAKCKVILGQTATSGDAAGFSKGQAQENVRADILEADCRALAATVRRDILTPLTAFRYGPGAPVPELVFDLNEPEDREKNARIVNNLSNAGYDLDLEDITAKCGFRVVGRKPAASGVIAMRDAPNAGAARRAIVVAAQQADEDVAKTAVRKITGDAALAEAWLGPVQSAIEEALAGLPTENPSPEDQAKFGTRIRALLDSIPALYRQMDTRALEEELTRAMFAGDTNGRLAAAAATGK